LLVSQNGLWLCIAVSYGMMRFVCAFDCESLEINLRQMFPLCLTCTSTLNHVCQSVSDQCHMMYVQHRRNRNITHTTCSQEPTCVPASGCRPSIIPQDSNGRAGRARCLCAHQDSIATVYIRSEYSLAYASLMLMFGTSVHKHRIGVQTGIWHVCILLRELQSSFRPRVYISVTRADSIGTNLSLIAIRGLSQKSGLKRCSKIICW
jgi:hypothetical protein